jgi:hypothetical protein
MHPLEIQLSERFARWDIKLPDEAYAQQSGGKITKAGWCIWYQFGKDESGEYLDYYSSHRMTSDSHVRVRADGSEEELPTISSMRWKMSEDPVEDARLAEEHLAENQRISEMLAAKGFGMEGDEPLSVQITRALSTGEVK